VNGYINEDLFQFGIPTLPDDFDEISASNDWFLYYSSLEELRPLSSPFPISASTDGLDSSLSAETPDQAVTVTPDDHEQQTCVAWSDVYSIYPSPQSATVPPATVLQASPEIVDMLFTPDLQGEPAASSIRGAAMAPSHRFDERTTFICHQCPDREPFQQRHLYKLVNSMAVLQFSTFTDTQYSKHRRRHDKPIKCTVRTCTKWFAFNRDLQRHLASKHHEAASITLFFCSHEGCGRTSGGRLGGFTRKDILTRHLRTQHNTSRS
jgi:hypothetical protein